MRITARRVLVAALVMVLGSAADAKPSRSRVDPQLTAWASEHGSARRAAVGSDTWPMIASGDGIVIHAASNGDPGALLAELTGLGMRGGAVAGNLVSGILPADAIGALESLRHLAVARPALATTSRELALRVTPDPRRGSVTSQGVAAIEADRLPRSVTGAGTGVGILADSFDCTGGGRALDTASGDLPADVTILDDSFTRGCSDEGRALAQIVHDVAPRARLGFRTGFRGQADMAQGIRALAHDFRADVIVEDVLYFDEPFFQDGVIARAIDEVHDQGVVVVSAVGNAGHRSYDAPFRDSGQTGFYQDLGETRRHDFDLGPGVDVFQRLTLPPLGRTILVLQWAEPSVSASTAVPPLGAAGDYDLIVYNTETPTAGNFADVFARSDSFNPGRDPLEIVQLVNPGAAPLDVYLAIERFALPGFDGPDVDRMKIIDFGSIVQREWDTGDGATSFGHANARGALAVGAAAWFATPRFGVSPPLAETYSSAGGVPIVFDPAGLRFAAPIVRATPDLVAPDGVNTTFYEAPGDIPEDVDAFPNFFGTSAAAPHVAGVAALLQGRALRGTGARLSSDEIERLLGRSAVDMSAPGYDFDTGYGLVDALSALDALTHARPR
jgi:subtilisin family serine protease